MNFSNPDYGPEILKVLFSPRKEILQIKAEEGNRNFARMQIPVFAYSLLKDTRERRKLKNFQEDYFLPFVQDLLLSYDGRCYTSQISEFQEGKVYIV